MISVAVLLSRLDRSNALLTTLRHLLALARTQVRVHVYVEQQTDDKLVRELLHRGYGCQSLVPHGGWRILGAHDLLLATDWRSAEAVAAHPGPSRRAYWVQQFEPSSYPMGGLHLLAEHTLAAANVELIASGQSLASQIFRISGRKARVVEIGVDTENYRPLGESRAKEFAVAVEYAPGCPRQLPQLMTETITYAHQVLPHLKIYTFGGDPAPVGVRSCHLGMASPQTLNEVFHRCLLGMSASGGHPSPALFAMLAAGLPVLSAHSYGASLDLPEDCVACARPDAAAFRTTLVDILADEPRRTAMSRAALEFARSRPVQNESLQFCRHVGDIIRGVDVPPLAIQLPSGSKGSQSVAKNTDLFELLTVDVWDTLLRRRCHPDEIKLFTARYVWLKYAPHLRPGFPTAWSLLAERIRCERQIGADLAEQGFDDEYRLNEVLSLWLSSALVSVDGGGPWELVSSNLAALELEQEKRCSYADHKIAGFLGAIRARKIVFVSDFYMPASSIRELLIHAGMGGLVAGGVSSCDVGLNKRSGRLFQAVHEIAGLDPVGHCHVGDNQYSDYFVPRTLGIAAKLYESQVEGDRCRRLAAEFAGRDGRIGFAPEAIRALLNRRNRDEPESDADAMFQLGEACTPLLGAFVLYLAESALREDLGKVHFFTREGEFFARLYNELSRSDPLGARFPDAVVLEVSRLATFAASLRSFDVQEFMRLWNLYSTQSLGGFFTSLDLSPEPLLPVLRHHGLVLEERIRYPWKDPRIIRLFGDRRFSTCLASHSASARQRLLRYLESKGLPATERRVGVVDIGWRGTIQDNLAWILRDSVVYGWYLGLAPVLNEQPPNARKFAFGPSPADNEDIQRLLGFVSPLEMLCNSDSGTTLRYVEQGAKVVAQHAVDEREDLVYRQYSRHFQAGVLSRIGEFGSAVRERAVSATELRPVALECLSELVHNPPRAAAKAYFSLNHNETFGVGSFDDKQRYQARIQEVRELYETDNLEKFEQSLIETTWPQGFTVLCGIKYPYFRLTPSEPRYVPLADKRQSRAMEKEALSLYGRGELLQSETTTLRALALNPWRPKLHYLAFRTCLRLGQTKTAMQHYRLLRKLTTKHPPALNEFACGTYSVDAGNSLRLFQILVEEAPRYLPGVLNLARVYLLAQRDIDALALLEKHAPHFRADQEFLSFRILAQKIAAGRLAESTNAAILARPGDWMSRTDLRRVQEFWPDPAKPASTVSVRNAALKALLRLQSDDQYLGAGGDTENAPSESNDRDDNPIQAGIADAAPNQLDLETARQR